jgi:hypothetical protein
MESEPKKPDYYLIDINDKEELVYIATKLGCHVSDILTAIETLKTRNRAKIYSYIIDGTFKAHFK